MRVSPVELPEKIAIATGWTGARVFSEEEPGVPLNSR